mmetsp:Transcript_106873/g.307352  ORF Transcript_106873/g.307352 Transcript_106873/m.307352 type:complete len:192 (+) Transcript_106873:91-666(+)
MFFLTCCTPPEDEVHQLGFGTVTDEAISGRAQQEGTPTLLTSHGQTGIDKKELGPALRDSQDSAPRAAKGCACAYLDEDSGKRSPATYRIDHDAASFVVSWAPEGGNPSEIVCPISTIEDIYTVADGHECFSSAVLAGLKPEERGGLFLVIFAQNPTDQPSAICLLEASESARDKLLELLKLASLSQAGGK